jgi:hypothetical protein
MFTRKIFKKISANTSLVLTLPVLILLAVSFIPVQSQTPEKPGPWIPSISNIRVVGEIASPIYPRKSFLSVDTKGSYTDLYNRDDTSGRQRWVFKLSPDGVSYNILVGGGTTSDRKYLSVTQDGTKVDLYSRDDGSGRQRWIVEPVLRKAETTSAAVSYNFHLMIRGGVNTARKYLSSNPDGSKIELSPTLDASKHQLWALSLPPNEEFYIQSSSGASTGTSILGKTDNLRLNILYSADDDSGRQRWNLTRLPYYGEREVYHIWTPGKSAGSRVIMNIYGIISPPEGL